MNEFQELQKLIEKLLKNKEKNLTSNYAKSYKNIKKDLDKFYDKAEDDGKLKYTKREMLELEKNTAKEMQDLYKENEKVIKDTLLSIVQSTVKVSEESAVVPIKKTLNNEKIINSEMAGRIWKERIEHYGDNFVYDIHSIIKAGLERGDTYTTVGKSIKEKFGKDLKNPVRIARTEGGRVLESTKYETFKEVNNNKNLQVYKIWRTMEDEAVRSSHQAMEGVKVKFDEDFILPSGATCQYPKSTGYPEEDINCRCYVEYVTEVVEKIDKTSEKTENLGYNKDDKTERVYENIPVERIDEFFKSQENYVDWINNLTEQDKESVFIYTTTEYRPINTLLRKGYDEFIQDTWSDFNFDKEELPYIKRRAEEVINEINGIKNAISKFKTEKSFKVYRGTTVNEIDYYKDLKIGEETIIDKAFISTSLNKDIINDFQGDGKIYEFEITVPSGYQNGAYISELSDITKEKEFLFNPSSMFKVVDIVKTDNASKILLEALK